MKVWISLCLVWLMVRVVSAGEPMRQEAGPYDFTRIDLALKTIPVISITDESEEHDRVFALLDKFSSLEELMRGSLALIWNSSLGDLGWSLPRPEITLSTKDRFVFNAIATRYLYPEVRLVEALSGLVSDRVERNGFLISRSEREAAQEQCQQQKDYTIKCVLKISVKAVAEEFSADLNKDYGSSLPAIKLERKLRQLIARGGSQSALYRDAFVADTTRNLVKLNRPFDLMMSCFDNVKGFFNWQIVGKRLCGPVIEEKYQSASDLVVDPEVAQVIINDIFNPFSRFQIYMVSLSEEVLNRGVFCRTQSCKERKLHERLDEWSYAGSFSKEQKRQLAKTMASKWLE